MIDRNNLTDAQRDLLVTAEEMGLAAIKAIGTLGESYQLSLAKTKVVEAITWVHQHIVKK